MSSENNTQIEQIITGWANVVKDRFNLLDPNVKALSESRLFSCDVCIMRTGNKCDPSKIGTHEKTGHATRGCGCNISAKTLSPRSVCPLGKC